MNLDGSKIANMNTLKILRLVTGQNFILPFYHAVADESPLHLKHLYQVRSGKTFENDLDYLLQHYTAVSITDVYNHITGIKPLPKHAFFISFDDGLTEFKEFAWPILKCKGVPVTLFVNPSFVDNKQLFFRFKAALLIDFIQKNQNTKLLNEANELLGSIVNSVSDLEHFVLGVKYPQKTFLDDLAEYFSLDFNSYLKTHKPYLSTNELIELQSQGVNIGAHSMDHPLFNQLNPDEMLFQFNSSVQWVQSKFNLEIKAFSFPFTDFGIKADFFETIFNPIESLVDLTFGTAGLKNERFKNHLQRIPVEDYDCNMQQILQKQYMYYLAKAPFFKNTITR
jgi:peptidoglycan/xylan/chitin deacetylase (PgdA/CDA1 family)